MIGHSLKKSNLYKVEGKKEEVWGGATPIRQALRSLVACTESFPLRFQRTTCRQPGAFYTNEEAEVHRGGEPRQSTKSSIWPLPPYRGPCPSSSPLRMAVELS